MASAEAPLRLIVAGDSLAEGLGVQTENLGIDSGVVSTQRSTQISTGLARSDVYDWPTELQRIANLNPEVVVVLFGGNDHQPMALPDGSVRNVGSPEWNAEYRRRASIVLEILAKPGRTIVWVGQPGMRDGSYNEIMQLINGLVTEEVKARKDTVFVDTVRLLGGGYVPFIAGSDGAQIKIREGDGVHPTATGYRIMARAVLDVIKQRGHLP